jgi:predicted transcriptional regulator
MARWESKYPLSRLGLFLKVHGVTNLRLAEFTGVSRQHLYRLRHGQMDATLDMMRRLRDGCTAILGRRVWMSEIFDVSEDDVLLLLAFGKLVLRVMEENTKGGAVRTR